MSQAAPQAPRYAPRPTANYYEQTPQSLEPSYESEIEPWQPAHPTPAPRTHPVPLPVPLPDSQVDPFRDEEASRIRKVPARTIQYQPQNQRPTRTYGAEYDPQAASGIHFRLSDGPIGEYAAGNPTSGGYSRHPVITASSAEDALGLQRVEAVTPLRPAPQRAIAPGAYYYNPLR